MQVKTPVQEIMALRDFINNLSINQIPIETLPTRVGQVITSFAKDITNNTIMLPRLIGESQKWYQSGLRYSAEYPYPYTSSVGSFSSGAQYFMPFTALENATITTLEIQCASAQVNAIIHLGIYASDSNNDVAAPLFTSAPISCSTTGIKNASCNVQIVKGKVYWLSILPIGSLAFYRNAQDSLFPIKGSISASSMAPLGYYTINNTSMTQSAPTSKLDSYGSLPRVMFVVG